MCGGGGRVGVQGQAPGASAEKLEVQWELLRSSGVLPKAEFKEAPARALC